MEGKARLIFPVIATAIVVPYVRRATAGIVTPIEGA